MGKQVNSVRSVRRRENGKERVVRISTLDGPLMKDADIRVLLEAGMAGFPSMEMPPGYEIVWEVRDWP